MKMTKTGGQGKVSCSIDWEGSIDGANETLALTLALTTENA
jgi:hypothetical protein